VITNYLTLKLEGAKRAIEAYNSAVYFGCRTNTDIDENGCELFQQGLGATYDQILEQLKFIGIDYGGVRAHPAAIRLARTSHATSLPTGQLTQVLSTRPPLFLPKFHPSIQLTCFFAHSFNLWSPKAKLGNTGWYGQRSSGISPTRPRFP
jgi:hypothetical protein